MKQKIPAEQVFERLRQQSIDTINKTFLKTAMYEKPALLSFDEAETDTLSYTAVRNELLIANYTLEVTLPQIDAAYLADFEATKLAETTKQQILDSLRRM